DVTRHNTRRDRQRDRLVHLACALFAVWIPSHLVSNGNVSILQHFGIDTAAPIGCHRQPQSVERFIHPLTWLGLSSNAEAGAADPENAVARMGQLYTADHEVCPAGRWRNRRSKLPHQVSPFLLGDDRHLAPASLVGVALEASTRDHGSSWS